MDLHTYLKEHRLIMDGATGTYFEEKYPDEKILVEKANTLAPEKIKGIHLEYLNSGARMIRTNTFATNTMFFDSMEEVKENIRAACRIAKEAVSEFQMQNKQANEPEEAVFWAADIEQLYSLDGEEEEIEESDPVLEEYLQICDTFLECGADIFVFETLSQFRCFDEVTRYIKEKKPNAFILLQFAFDRSGYTKAGLSVRTMVHTAASMEAIDAYGFNCGVAAAHLRQLIKEISFPGEKFVSALPNGSYPYELRGQMIYSSNASYYARMMGKIADCGMDILGGCCGTKPSYIAKLAERLQNTPRIKKKTMTPDQRKLEQHRAKIEERSEILKKMNRGEKVFVVELDPPFELDISKVISGAKRLKETKCDLITLADSPMARTRMDALQLAGKVQRETGMCVMPHICCRDKNLIAMRSSLLGAHMNEIRNFLFVTGDPVPRGSREHITSVFNFNSIQLMQYVKEMNQEVFADEPVLYFGALNYHGVNAEAIAARMQKKMEAGCRGFLTQPIYSDSDVERILWLKEKTGAKILCGIMPLVSYKNAVFIKNEMPGIQVTDEIIERYQPDMSREAAETAAVEISLEIIEKLYDKVEGFYLMTPFNRYELVASIIEKVCEIHKER
ncbi:MAG: bifunctional homocysteine S-methyltransferase/methylenetetrahydrofolate reductase [Lachnospiraceae bacterium]